MNFFLLENDKNPNGKEIILLERDTGKVRNETTQEQFPVWVTDARTSFWQLLVPGRMAWQGTTSCLPSTLYFVDCRQFVEEFHLLSCHPFTAVQKVKTTIPEVWLCWVLLVSTTTFDFLKRNEEKYPFLSETYKFNPPHLHCGSWPLYAPSNCG